MEITGTAQHAAWQAKALPPVEQLRPDLWSVPVPMGGPLRYVSVYAFTLDGGGLGLPQPVSSSPRPPPSRAKA